MRSRLQHREADVLTPLLLPPREDREEKGLGDEEVRPAWGLPPHIQLQPPHPPAIQPLTLPSPHGVPWGEGSRFSYPCGIREEKGRRNLKIQLAALQDYHQSNGTKTSLRIRNTIPVF